MREISWEMILRHQMKALDMVKLKKSFSRDRNVNSLIYRPTKLNRASFDTKFTHFYYIKFPFKSVVERSSRCQMKDLNATNFLLPGREIKKCKPIELWAVEV